MQCNAHRTITAATVSGVVVNQELWECQRHDEHGSTSL